MKSNKNKIQGKYRKIMREKETEEDKKPYQISTILAISILILFIVLNVYIDWF
jgi:hypothetical protein